MPGAPTQHAKIEDMTQRKQAQDDQQENERLFRLLFEKSGDANLLLDGDVFTDCNKAALKMLGCPSKEELLPFHPRDLSPQRQPDGRLSCEKEKELIAIALRQGSLRFEWTHRRLDGTDFPVEILLTAIPLHGKKVLHTAWRDVTARKQAEEKNRRRTAQLETLYRVGQTINSKLDLRAILDQLTDEAMHVTHAAYGSTFLVRPDLGRFEQHSLRGYPAELPEATLPISLPLDSGLNGQAYHTRQIVCVDDVKSAPEYVPDVPDVRSEMIVPIIRGDQVLGTLDLQSPEVGAFHDADLDFLRALTDQAAIALENARLHDDAQRHARELSVLTWASTAVTFPLDLEVVLRLVIDGIQRTMGTEAVSVLLCEPAFDNGNQELVFAAVVSSASEKLVGKRIPITAGIAGWVVREKQGVVVAEAQQDSHFYSHIDGVTGMNTHSLLAVPLLTKGAVIGVIETVNKTSGVFTQHDLEMLEAIAGTAAVAIENARLFKAEREQYRRLQESQTQLIQAEKMTALGRLAATLAHEINNPLQAITSDLELILDFPLDPEERVKRLRVARQEIDRLSEMTRRVLAFARPSLAPRESVSVADLIKQTLSLAGKKLQHSHIQVTTDLVAAPPIMAAPNQLVQVFLNLVINAIEAIYDHGQIHISLGVEGEQVVARFANDGPPIAPDDLPRIFEPFFTTKEDGTGLGLSVSHSLITQHGGTLTVENLTHKQGVVFVVRLPLIRGDDRPGSKT